MKSYRRLLQLVTPYRLRLIAGIVTGLLYAFCSSSTITVVEEVLAAVFPATPDQATSVHHASGFLKSYLHFELPRPTPGTPLSPWQIAGYALLVPAIFLARGFFAYLNGYMMNWIGLRVVMDLRNQLFAHLHTLSLDFFNKTPIGDLMSRVSNDCDIVRRSVSTTLADLCQQPFTIVLVLAKLFALDWKFTLAALVLLPVSVGPMAVFGRKVRQASRRTQENMAQLTSILHESFTAIRIVKAFGMEQHEIRKFRENTARLIRITMRVVRASQALSPLIEFLGALGIAAAFVYAYGRMSQAQFTALAMGLYMLYEPVKNLSKVQITLQQSAAATDRVYQLLDTPSSITNAPDAAVIPAIRDQIVFENVSFSYGEKPVLENISLTVRAGSVLALVGPTGSGKTSLLNLIPRFYDPTAGRITIDGRDLKQVTIESLRKQIGIVTQETILFDDTVANNIAYGSPGATREQIVEVARKAHADLFIQQMPLGYDTVVGDKGVRLSGGERQRLAIARALLKNPPILILDEAMSALDSKTEKLVQEAIDELMSGRTVFAIAHRLSTIQHADCILALDAGRIVERGTHAELLAQGGLYKRLHDQQFRQ